VLWRSGVHQWLLGEGGPTWIRLGPFDEPFRKFLNRQLLLERAVLFLNVSQSRTDMKSEVLPQRDQIDRIIERCRVLAPDSSRP